MYVDICIILLIDLEHGSSYYFYTIAYLQTYAFSRHIREYSSSKVMNQSWASNENDQYIHGKK